ncbi:MAG: EAL domain-containing protein [Gammaproteobacteria bacterium]|nr:EAL domain-containing protein [Gammaproteobacteria bacterium]
MDSVNLLVTDRSPDAAERINSLLRNSGIKIHVIHAASVVEVKRSLDNDAPVMLLYADADDTDAPLEEVANLALAFNVPFALFTDVSTNQQLTTALEATACFVIHSELENLLTESVSRLIRNAENERMYASRQQRLEELEHRYNLLLDSSRDPIAYIHEGLHVYANRAYLEALRLENPDDTMALSLLELIKPKDEATDMKSLLRGLSRGEFPEAGLEVEVNRPDGSVLDASLLFSPARFDGEDCTQMMMQRKDAASELASELERMRVTDPLTGLANRKAFMSAVDERIASEEHDSVAAVLYLEPDGFDALQSDLSADALDEFLADLAQVIRHSLDESDLPARINEEGFGVLALRPSVADMETLAETLLKNCRNHVIEAGDRAFSISCSIGIRNIGRLATDAPEILAQAREVCAAAAEDGDRFEIFRPQLTAVESADGEQDWINRINEALRSQDLYTVQQSIVDLDGEGEQLVENISFLRGENGDHSSLEFQQIAERNDLAGAIDRKMIPGLLRTFVDSSERQIINLSSNSILDYSFPGWLVEQVREACIEGDRIILQIAASAAHSNLRPAQRLMTELEPLGCRLSVGQFDAGLKSLQLLDHLETSYVKLDRTLMADLLVDSRKQDDVRKVVKAAEPHGVAVIADEVADTASLAVLWQCGVKLISGAFLNESSQVIAQ